MRKDKNLFVKSDKTLLEKALEIRTAVRNTGNFSDEELEVVQAWLNDDVTLTQVMNVIARPPHKPTTAQAYVFLSRGSRELFRRMNRNEKK